MKKIYFLFLTILMTSVSFGQEALITGYVDSPCPSQLGRTVEIYVDGTIDFTGWNLVRQSNGGGFTTNIDLSTLGSITDAFAYITNDSAALSSEFGITSNVLVSGAVTDNGDDAFQIVDNNTNVIDQFGETNVDGTGQSWEHLDTYYYRVDGVPANAGTFLSVDFTYGALNALDGEGLCNGANALSTFVPFGSYSTTASTTPTVTISGTVGSMDYFENNGPSGEESFAVSGINLTQNISVTAPANFELSLTSGGAFTNSVSVTQTAGTANPTTVYIRLGAGLAVNTYAGDVTATSTTASDVLSVSGTVSPANPQITVVAFLDPLNYTEGAGPSAADVFTVEGLFLTSDISVSAPTNYEVSMDDVTFSPNVSITPDGSGTVATTNVYVRLAAGLTINTYTGDITVSSTGVTNETIAVSGTVFGPPTNALVLVGVYDGPNPGGTPKGIELYALADIPDLSVFGISSITNGAGSSAGNIEYSFPADAIAAGDRIFLATEGTEFNNFFGMAPTYVNGVVGINGDDSIELYENGQIIDTFGDVNVDGTGETWDYLDGWAYRLSNSGPRWKYVCRI
ncbi:T9SS C-terminal target domain-containing protein [Lacinutrix neustonica]|uniref:T9SS C-terminal target domain-containing protein n=1 Tax=Lacinutrix neustonica TaxID=2980107 RepID=A0A9E8MVZ7_9FLAO|nr:T9SS C-terminal target domain-containing protein [Lacinutrix neustonica]WAC01305.1 T9SS C-terminal target domain-containing protein [Lacinutrix neustonica]